MEAAVVEVINTVDVKVDNVLGKVVDAIWGLELEEDGSKNGMIEVKIVLELVDWDWAEVVDNVDVFIVEVDRI